MNYDTVYGSKTPIVDPRGYFARGDDPFPTGTGIFALHVVLNLIVAYFLASLLFSQVAGLSSSERNQLLSVLAFGLALAAIVYVVAWLVVDVIMHYMSGGSETDGTITDALGVAGWAYAPEIVALAPTVAYTWRHVQALDLDGLDPAQVEAEIDALVGGELGLVTFLLFAAVTIWSVFILAKGVSETHDVFVDTAAVPAAVVGLGSVFFYLVA